MIGRPYFDEALPCAANVVRECLPEAKPEQIRFVRELSGRLFVVVPDTIGDTILEELRSALFNALGSYSPGHDAGVARVAETLGGEALLAERVLIELVDTWPAYLIERRVAGQDWLLPPESREHTPPRVTFFSLKGGVGRSTALILWALHLIKRGKRTLLVDLDLEAPGLGSQLLPESARPRFGVVDWLAEALVGRADEGMVENLVASSNLAPSSALQVVPAAGTQSLQYPHNYIAKLARAYIDGDQESGVSGFSQRVSSLLGHLENFLKPDVVLIDSRAGLHEMAAGAILQLDAYVLFFATGLAPTWEGYRYLFSHLKQLAQSSRSVDGSGVLSTQNDDWRDRLKMVHAKAPANPKVREAFVSASYGLWVDTIYDEVSAEEADVGFSFDEKDEDAPHFPLRILRSGIFEEFDPLIQLESIGDNEVREAFGSFFHDADAFVLGEESYDE